MMQVSLYGRLGKDPQQIQTKTGTPMAAASVAVDVGQRDQEATVWVRVVCFNKLADQLAKHAKADPIAASGRLELSRWTGDDGAERESWQLIADAIVSARTVRPGSTRGQKRDQPTGPAPVPFDDTIPPF